MTVKELKHLLEGVDENVTVLIPETNHFNGAFYQPCLYDSGIIEMGEDEHSIEEPAFVLCPCGFYDQEQHDHEKPEQLN